MPTLAGQKLRASQVPGTLVGAPTATSSNGTTVTNATASEVRDAVLGNFVFTSLGTGHYYRVWVTGAVGNHSLSSDQSTFLRVRDGGASTPTTSSTLVTEVDGATFGIGVNGRMPFPVSKVVTFSAGTHTLSTFWVSTGSGTWTFTPFGDRQLYVEYMGPV